MITFWPTKWERLFSDSRFVCMHTTYPPFIDFINYLEICGCKPVCSPPSLKKGEEGKEKVLRTRLFYEEIYESDEFSASGLIRDGGTRF